MTTMAAPPARSDLHNTSVNSAAAAAGYCGALHLPTGRVCLLPHRHSGSCRLQLGVVGRIDPSPLLPRIHCYDNDKGGPKPR